MCKIGDIILISKYKHEGKVLDRHSFVVLDDKGGQIEGLDYDLVCNVMSSFKNDEQRKRKLKYPGNFPITHDDSVMKNNDKKDGYIKTDQLYYFKKEKINYIVIGRIKDEIFNLILDFIENESIAPIQDIIDNL